VLESRQYEGYTIDLSEDGVALRVGHYLPFTTKLYMEFVMFESEQTDSASFYEPLTLSGEIRSVVPLEHCQYRLGICFEGVPDEKRDRIFDLTHSLLKPVGA